MARCTGIIFLLLLGVASTANAQFPYGPTPPLPPAAGPLMYVRFSGPDGAKIMLYRGNDAGQTLELPVTVGFRPGYSYRFSLFDLPKLPRQVFSPSMEVRGSLALSPKQRNADYPANIVFNEEELGRIVLGAHVKKIVTLERPDQAIPVASKKDEPIEIQVPATRDVVSEAAQRGQPLVVLNIGQRFLTPEELKAMGQPGTILLPGERVLGSPKIPPYLFWNWCPVYDPVHGPRPPSESMTIYDGGDTGGPAGTSRDGKLRGLDPTDTVAEYLDSKGNKKLAVSNRVGICVPRFIVLRSEYGLAAQKSRITIDSTIGSANVFASTGQIALKEGFQQTRSEAVGTKMRLSSAFNSISTSVVGRMQGLQVKSSLANTESVSGSIAGLPPQEAADGPLRIIKWPDKDCVNVGDVVTFYLKYSNTGGQPITGVIVSDSLASRFEYVKGSAKTDREATFTSQMNEVGSSVVRWEFSGTLQPREHGMISFQVRVR